MLAKYLRMSTLPTPPASCDYATPAAMPVLSMVLGNDTLGDCVIAGGYHLVGAATGNAGALFTPTMDQILADYSAIGGYVPGDPSTDTGCDELTALAYWQTHGFADGTHITGSLAIDATNQSHVQAACWLFEGLMFGIELPDAWVSPIPSGSGFTWDEAGAPDPNNGHCIVGLGYQPAGVTPDSWGMLGTLTWDAITAYCTEAAGGGLYCILTTDMLAKGQAKAPNGFDWGALIEDFGALGGAT
jgi:hypothetical protein